MSRLIKIQGFVVLLMALIATTAPVKELKAQPNVSVSFQTFYNDLQPYGQWIDYPQYGYCWVPNVGNGFRPYYTNGYWAMTEYGNTWVSNYNWGWAPFHYGNWTYDDYYGWIWVPGNTWGPAWVSWRNGGGYYGWAPIAPGININVAIGNYNCSPNWWVFVPQRHIYARNYSSYWRGPQYNTTIIRNTTIINNTYINNNHRYISGPRRNEIERVTGRSVRTYGVRSEMKPGRSQVRGNTLNVYRPTVNSRNNERPERYVNANERRTTPANHSGSRNNDQRSSTPNRMSSTQRASSPNQARPNTTNNSRPSRTANTRAPQQQQRITERRQQSWQQQRSQPARQQHTQPQRGHVTQNRPQSTNRSMPDRARPQSNQHMSQPARQQHSQQRASQPARSNTTHNSGQRGGSRGR
ncbi:MAG: hypothetical protein H6550_06470 [Chitinophagales bacterium]|nr:hypothetical protein [Chitinophagales bacterium]